MTEIIHLQERDDIAVLRDRLRKVPNGRVILVLPWEASFLSRPLDGELVQREAERLGLEIAVVSEDPDRRAMLRATSLAIFASVDQAKATTTWRRVEAPPVEPPGLRWWEEEIPLEPAPKQQALPWMRRARTGVRLAIFAVTILLLLIFAYVVIPQATVSLVSAAKDFVVIVPVSARLDAELVDTQMGTIPAGRVGDWFEGSIEIETSGTVAFQSGRSVGNALFTNVLGQSVTVPSGTVVRTSSGTFAVRFTTTEDVSVPAFGQASAPIEAMIDGPVGNVGANMINRVEGIAALAVRVTNPEPTYGGETEEVRAVSRADMDRARLLLTEQLLGEAYTGLQQFLEPTQFLPRQSLVIQASEEGYNRFLTERADTLGLHMRVLVTGEMIDQDNAEAVAYVVLDQRLPSNFRLIGADFEIGEVAEEPAGTEDIGFFVTAKGRASAEIDPRAVRSLILGRSVARATEQLSNEMPLAEPADIQIWPEWLNRLPVLPLRIDVQIVPQG